MGTGFEGYIIIGAIVLGLFALAWRALGRHVTVNNNNAPTATANVSSESVPAGPRAKSIIGATLAIGIALAVGVFAFSAASSHVAMPVTQPAAVPVIVTVAPVVIEEYAPVALPAVPALDFGPMFGLIIVSAVICGAYWLMQRRSRGRVVTRPIASIQTIQAAPTGLTADLFDRAMQERERVKRG